MAKDEEKKKAPSTSPKKRKQKARPRKKAAQKKPMICPKCGQEMDKRSDGALVCGDCGWTISAKTKE